MKLLLDTHIFLWLDTAPEKLSATALGVCQDPNNALYLSVASAWEVEIKQRLGRLTLRIPLETMVEVQQRDNQLQLLPIVLDDVLAIRNLPFHHNDPFDRLIIAQARRQGASLVSADGKFAAYQEQVSVIW